tara:strand:- start:360 stop:986 length:627 start_codon:yes stop_codon:yes gene_type:complete
MHNSKEDIKVLVFGNNEFSSALIELKENFNFSLSIYEEKSISSNSIIVFHEDFLNKENEEILNYKDNLKILFFNKELKSKKIKYDLSIALPSSFLNIQNSISNFISKKKFISNSAIKLKDYLLDKNTKTLFLNGKTLILTEKEILILELLLKTKKPVGKEKFLSNVWNYADGVDTHTVETHIYRLRKKISEKFGDNNFITNNKLGYLL